VPSGWSRNAFVRRGPALAGRGASGCIAAAVHPRSRACTHKSGLSASKGRKEMTSFRRLVMGAAEMMAALSIFFGTFVGGFYGATLGTVFPSGIFGVDIGLQGIGQVATTGVVFWSTMGAILGFVVSSSVAGAVFFFAQIERNTRSL